jgi:gliding motility-associated-like protein
MKRILLLFLLLLNIKSFATHIVGGEITYEYISNNDYEIKLLVYRDCALGNAAFDVTGRITIFDNNGFALSVIEINSNTQITLPSTINNPCVTPPSNICYQRAEYITTENLPPIVGGYYLVYQRCCRNSTILNLDDPGGQGASFMEHIPGLETGAWNNSSPTFNSLPATFLCANSFFTYNHSATDLDGDVLVYEYSKAYKGLDRCCPLIGSPVSPGSPNTSNTNGCIVPLPALCPTEAYPPIAFNLLTPYYDSVDYQTGFTSKEPFGIGANITINPTTGIISGAPNITGQYVVTVSAKEYRNGILIGVHRREYQFNVTPCQKTIVSTIITPTILCKNGVNFIANTTYTGPNFPAYIWDFGNPASGASNTSTAQNPSHVFTDTGTYTISLTTYDALVPSCQDITVKTIRVINPVSATFSAITPACKNVNVPFTINVLSNTNNFGLSYNWNFNNPPSGINNVSALTNPIHAFTDTGTYNVQLIINVPSNPGCGDTVKKLIKITEYIKPNFAVPPNICKFQPIQINNTTSSSLFVAPFTYVWSFTNASISSSNIQNPTLSFNNNGLFNVSLLVSSNTIIGCKDSITKQISINQLQIIPNVPSNICNSLNVPFSATSNFSTPINYQWDFGDLATTTDVSNNQNTSYGYPAIGNYTYTLTAVETGNAYCKDSITGLVKILDIITPNFSSNIPFCANLPVKLLANSSHLGLGGLTHTWQSSFENQNGDSVLVQFPDSGNYNVTLTASNNLYANCKANITKPIKINPRIIAAAILDTLYCRNLNEQIINLSRGSKNPIYNWYYNINTSAPFSLDREPTISFSDTGNKIVYLIYKDSIHPECTDTVNKKLRIAPPPEISIESKDEKCKGGEANFEAKISNSTGRSNIVYWQFSDGAIDSGNIIQHTFPANGLFNIIATADVPSLKNCKDTSETINIKITGRGDLFIPNAFSPNKDNNNDVFKIEGPPYENFLMLVYNRFGEKIFESTDQNLGWDGKIRNEEAEAGVFGYYVKVKCPDGSTQVKKGNVSLLR